MRRAAIVLSTAGVLAAGGMVLGLRGYLVPPPEPQVEEAAAPRPTPRSFTVDTAKQARVRPVAPEAVAPPRIAPTELQRVEPREPLSRFAQPLPQRRKNQGRIFRPLITAAGQVAGSGLAVTIAGVEPTEPDATCVDANGVEWPCGVRARTAFRAFVRGRALACDLPEEITEKSYTVACSIGKQDVGGWLAGNGWVKTLPGSPYAEAAEIARTEGRGIFGMAPVIEPLAEAPTGDLALPALFPILE